MSRKKLLILVGAVLALFMSPTPGRAETSVAPPFDDAYNYDSCDGFVVSACASDSSIDTGGTFSISASMTSPNAGSLPGPASGGADVYLTKAGTLGKDVPAIELTVQIHIDEASIERTGGLPVSLGYGYIDLSIGVNAYGCYCYDYEYVTLADAEISTDAEDLTVTLLLRNGQGGPVKAGDLDLYIEVYGYGSLGGSFYAPLPNTGTLDMRASGAVTSVTARVVTG